MSRSYKKGYSSHSKHDKSFRKQYHRSVRRKAKLSLYEELKLDDSNSSEKIVLKGKDYGCKNADPWSWPSDGLPRFENNLNTLRNQFNEQLKDSYYYCWGNTLWTEYLGYLNTKFQKPEWKILYQIKKGQHRVAHDDWFFDTHFGENGRHVHIHTVSWEPIYIKVEKILNHYPTLSDIEDNSEILLIRKMGNQQASYDYELIPFLFHRNIIPNSFKNKSELLEWLHKNEEKIIRSWYRVLYSK